MTSPGHTILLVEDNAADAHLVRLALEECGAVCNVHTAPDGLEALKMLAAFDGCPSLVLLDLNLPVMNGHEFLRRLRSDEATWGLPVVVLSSSRAQSDIDQSYRLGANGYLQKPQDWQEMVRMMDTLTTFWLRMVLPPVCE